MSKKSLFKTAFILSANFILLIVLMTTPVSTAFLEIDDAIFPQPQFITKKSGISQFNPDCRTLFFFKNKTFSKEFLIDEILSFYTENLIPQRKNKRRNEFCENSIEITVKNNVLVSPFPSDNEKAKEVEFYQLSIDDSKKISLTVNYLNGIVRGLETLAQLFSNRLRESDDTISLNTPLFIEDYPNYAIRGVMIDSSRHFISIEKIKIIIDGMLHSKLNTLHWHLTDDDGFAFESKVLPVLHRNQEHYTQKEIKQLMRYAKVRGVQIIPEFDQPGHSRSWALSEELKNITIINPNNTQYAYLDPSSNGSISVAISLLNEAVKVFESKDKDNFNNSDLFHLGGDEINYDVWLQNERIQNFMKSKGFTNKYELINYYFNQIRRSLPKNKKYTYWIDADFFTQTAYQGLDVFSNENTILHYWGNSSILIQTLSKLRTDKKFNIILSPYDYTYLDCGTGNIYGDASWCDPYITWKKMVHFDPDFYNKTNFNVLGSIACVWTELVDDNGIIGKIFPRSSALGSRLWNSKVPPNVKKAYKQLIVFNQRLIAKGIKSTRIANKYCENHSEECAGFVW